MIGSCVKKRLSFLRITSVVFGVLKIPQQMNKIDLYMSDRRVKNA